MSDRIALIQRGRIEQLGTVHELYHRPATRFAAEFIGQANLLEAECVGVVGKSVRVRVTGGLELRVPAAAWPSGVARAHVAVRPEKVHLSRTPRAEENAFEARVEDEVFHGAIDRFALATAAGTRLMAVATNESAWREPIRVGDRVWAAVHPDDIAVIR